MNDLISIIVPVYNVELYLETCIKTILNQKYKNIEIILIDDGSIDLSGKICDIWGVRDSRIRVIHQKNLGLSAARNIGIKFSHGSFITFIDSDDYVSETMIEDLYYAAKKIRADIVTCTTKYCKENGVILNNKDANYDKKIYEGKDQLKALFKNNSGITTTAWGKLYKKKLFEGIQYPVGKYHEDIYTTYKLLETSNKTCIVTSCYYVYRQVSESITHCSFQKKHMDYLYGSIIRARNLQLNYPELKKVTNASIAYAACKLLKKKVDSENTDVIIEIQLKKAIRENLIDFLMVSESQPKTKIFAVAICLNIEIAKWLIKLQKLLA